MKVLSNSQASKLNKIFKEILSDLYQSFIEKYSILSKKEHHRKVAETLFEKFCKSKIIQEFLTDLSGYKFTFGKGYIFDFRPAAHWYDEKGEGKIVYLIGQWNKTQEERGKIYNTIVPFKYTKKSICGERPERLKQHLVWSEDDLKDKEDSPQKDNNMKHIWLEYPFFIFPIIFLDKLHGLCFLEFNIQNAQNYSTFSRDNKKRIKYCLKYFFDAFIRGLVLPLLELHAKQQQIEKYENEVKKYFSETFIKSLKDSSWQKKLVYKEPLQRFLDRLNLNQKSRRFDNATELTLNFFNDLWGTFLNNKMWGKNEKDLNETFPKNILESLKNIEALLFWLKEPGQNYREHLVHAIKVFLLGSRIIGEFYKDEQTKDLFQKLMGLNKQQVQLSWLLASTFHDISVPIQYVGPFLKTYFKQFLHSDISVIQERVNLADVIVRDELYFQFLESLQNLYYTSVKSKRQQFPTYRKKNSRFGHALEFMKFEDRFFNQIVQQEFVNYGDHGVAGALTMFGYLMNKDKGPKHVRDKTKNNSYASKVLLSAALPIMLHNLIFSKVVTGYRKGKKSFPHAIDFYEYPLCFLLILCDNLQDWGRPEQKRQEEIRPVGFITKFDSKWTKPNKNSVLEITANIEYRYPKDKNREEWYSFLDFEKVNGADKDVYDQCKKWIEGDKHVKYWQNVHNKLCITEHLENFPGLKVKVNVFPKFEGETFRQLSTTIDFNEKTTVD